MRYIQTGETQYDEQGRIIRSGFTQHQDRGGDRQHFIGGVFSPFVSPVDGRVISSPDQLKNHNRQHGVSNDPDSLKEQAARSQQKKEFSKQERIAVIRDAIEKTQSSGYNRRE